MQVVDPAPIAEKYLAEARAQVERLDTKLRIRGYIATNDKPSIAYARASRRTFRDVGFRYDLRKVPRLGLASAIIDSNADPDIHGIFVYFPVFHNRQDTYLRNLIHYTKDIEAGSRYWTRKLCSNDRLAISGEGRKKALLPCTPLAIVKVLTELGEYGKAEKPLEGRVVVIFNRSEVIGGPLALMMSNDGAKVYSFDLNGPFRFEQAVAHETDITRAEALQSADIVITGVPGNSFDPIRPAEISKETVCINFSSSPNFSEDIPGHARIFVPRVGPMTVAIGMRNILRLYENFHKE